MRVVGENMRIKYLGHAAFIIGEILVDPFNVDIGSENIRAIAVTHAHGDHVGEAIRIAKERRVPVVAIYELATYLSKKGVEVIGMNLGGSVRLGDYSLSMVPAVHSSGIIEEDNILCGGAAVGYVISKDGKTVYHAGDTMVFGDMKIIGDLFRVDVALLPIGGLYTMDIKQAVVASKLIRPQYVIPMHYRTWPVIEADPEELKRSLEGEGIRVLILRPGDEFYF